MKKNYKLTTLAIAGLLSIGATFAQTFWTGPVTTFTKQDGTDHTLTANQDSLTAKVIITRRSGGEIFNIVSETVVTGGSSPAGTEWAIGTIADGVENLIFDDFRTTTKKPKNVVSLGNMVLHLIEDDIYIDIKFTSWSSGLAGGFSYERSTPVVTNTIETAQIETTTVFPNPATNSIQVEGANSTESYNILDVLGNEVSNGILAENKQIDIQNLITGIYFLKLENGNIVKFIKE
ncbi:MAG: T9SS type A sorting domain-containing protein [Cytophagales bacterium]|nr:T9SS type A sorting domain-containing protein [Cytophagales bacterium]